jgi:putative DNA primase/helicase
VAIFKKICTGNRIKAERKGQDPFEFNPHVKMLFSANDIPRMRDKTGAVIRRLVIIPFNAVFSDTDPDYDPFIKYKLCQRDSMEYLIQVGIKGLLRVLAKNRFTSSEKVELELTEYEEENNPIVAFIRDSDPEEIFNQPTSEVYRRYQVFCTDAAMQPMSKIVFSKQMVKRLKLEVVQQKIGKKNCRIFMKRG